MITDEAVMTALDTFGVPIITHRNEAAMRRVLEQFAASAPVASCAVNVTELAGMVNKELASMGLVLASAPVAPQGSRINRLFDYLEATGYSVGDYKHQAIQIIQEQAAEIERLRDALNDAFGSHRQIIAERDDHKRKLDDVIAALTPSAETKRVYIGEFKTAVPYWDEEGELERTREHMIEWTTIKEIMKAIRAQARLTEGESA